VNLCLCNSPYSLNCHVGAMLVFRMLCRITQSSDAHRTKSILSSRLIMPHVQRDILILSAKNLQTRHTTNMYKTVSKYTQLRFNTRLYVEKTIYATKVTALHCRHWNVSYFYVRKKWQVLTHTHTHNGKQDYAKCFVIKCVLKFHDYQVLTGRSIRKCLK